MHAMAPKPTLSVEAAAPDFVRGLRVAPMLLALVLPCAAIPAGAGAQSDGEADVVRITARVQDVDTRADLLGAVLELSGVANRHVTGLDGRVSFDAAIGDYTLTVRKGGYATLRGDFRVIRPGDFTLRLSQSDEGDMSAPSRLVVRVVDSYAALPIEGATVTLAGGAMAVTNAEGRAEFTDLESRLVRLEVEMIGYAARTEPVTLHPDRTTAVEVEMTIEAVPLRPLRVEVRSRFLEANGVYRRMDQGRVMHLLTKRAIEERGSPRISDAFSHVPGLKINRESVYRSVLMAPSNCPLSVYVDGIPFGVDIEGSVNIDQIPPSWVELAEVYWGSRAPIEYRGNACGVVLIWTRQSSRPGSVSDGG